MSKHYNTGPGFPQTRAEVEEMSDTGLAEFMGCCHVEPADYDNCLACYAFEVAESREKAGLPKSNVPILITSSPGPLRDVEWPVTNWLRGIYDLLANGVNVKVTLTKENGEEYSYRLKEPVR